MTVMVLNKFRHIADKITKTQVRFLVRIGIKPNILSIFGLIFGLFAAISFSLPEIFMNSRVWAWVPPLVYFFSGYFDLVDGSVARETKTNSKFGGFLDSTLDRIADSATIVGLMIGNMLWVENLDVNYVLGFIGLTFTLLISYTRSRAENEGVVMKGIGLMERGERFFMILLGIIVETVLRAAIPQYSQFFFPIYFCLFLILCIYTVIVRIVYTYRWLNGKVSTKSIKKQNISIEEERN